MMRMRHPLLVPFLASAALLVPATAAQADFVGVTDDPAGDATDPAAGRDISLFGITYDRATGSVEGEIHFRGSPEDTPGFIVMALGQRTATGCNGYPAVTLSGDTDDIDSSWLRLDTANITGAKGEADKRGTNNGIQTIEAQSKALAGRRYNCAIASVSSQDGQSVQYDNASAKLVGQPALSVGTKAPKVFPRNRTRTVRFAVSNPGDGPARGVKLRLGKASGLSINKRTIALRTIAPGKRKIVKVKMRFSNKASTSTSLAIKATSGKLVASGDVSLAVKPLPNRPSKGGRGGTRTPMLCNQFAPDFGGGGSLILVPC